MFDGYGAKAAGVKAQDIIISVGGYRVDSLNALSRALDKFDPGDKVIVTVWSAGVEKDLEVVLSEKPAE